MSEDNEFKKMLDKIQVELDPERIEKSITTLQDKVRRLTNDGLYTKVRIKFRDRVIVPEIPLGVFLAAEAATFWYAGLIRALAVNLGMRTFIEVEFIHQSAEKIAEGKKAYDEGEVEVAESLYREALDMRPDDPIASYHLGVLLRVTGRRDEAIRCFEVTASYDCAFKEKAQLALEKMKRGNRSL